MPWSQVFDGSGNTLAGAKLYFYNAGTSTLKNIYADIDMTTALSNPVIADAGGRFVPIYFDGLPYKVALYTANDVLIWTADYVENETTEVDAELAIQAITKTATSAGYTQTQAEDPNNFPKAVYKYANAANYYTETGSTGNAYVLEGLNAYERPNDYFVGQQVIFVSARPNTSSSVTVNVEGLGAKTVKRFDGSNIAEGDIYGLVHLVYDGTYLLLFEQASSFKIGDIKASLQSANHGFWLLCDGQAVSRTEYAVLFALIGTNFGTGDGETTFNVPDYRGKFLRGLGGNSAADIYTTQSEGIPNHTHATGRQTIANNGNSVWNSDNEDYVLGTKAGAMYWNGSESYNIETALTAGSSLITGLGGTYTASTSLAKTDNLASDGVFGASDHVTPINQAVNWFIKAK